MDPPDQISTTGSNNFLLSSNNVCRSDRFQRSKSTLILKIQYKLNVAKLTSIYYVAKPKVGSKINLYSHSCKYILTQLIFSRTK